MAESKTKQLMVAVLSLSLLTVMAGAAVAPALDVIREHFADASVATVQMVISMPALFIALTNPLFSSLARRFTAKELCLGGLVIYVVAGVAAGLVDNLVIVLVFRALVGVSVGIIMPLSTGLLAFYFPPEQQSKLMGYSSAMNQMGGVVATLIAGLLATISWRTAFAVYLMGVICILLCAGFVPNEMIAPTAKGSAGNAAARPSIGSLLKRHGVLIAAMFFLMLTFFVYPSSYAMESAKEGILPPWAVTLIMAWLDIVAFAGGLAFAGLRKRLGRWTRFLSPALFVVGYVLLFTFGGWFGGIVGSAIIGFANGAGVPFVMSTASLREGRAAATTVLPLISMALYLSQFVTPMILSAAKLLLPQVEHLPYLTALASAVLFGVISAFIRDGAPDSSSK